jgi:hypothetical protein
MLNKVDHQFMRAVAIAALFCVLSPVSGQSGPDMLGGNLIPATPFDRQINAASNYNTAALFPDVASSDQLFFQARGIRYVPDPAGQDHWQTPEETQQRWAGDCEDKAFWLFAQLKQNGYSHVRLVIGRYRALDSGFHVWVTLVDDHGDVFVLDPTAQRKIWKASDFSEEYYRALYSFDGMNRYRHDPQA